MEEFGRTFHNITIYIIMLIYPPQHCFPVGDINLEICQSKNARGLANRYAARLKGDKRQGVDAQPGQEGQEDA
jgi:hypothetical protein